MGRVLPPDNPLPSLQISTRSSIGIRRPREERFIRFLNQAGDRAVPDSVWRRQPGERWLKRRSGDATRGGGEARGSLNGSANLCLFAA